jgi:hypothetical protein
MLVKSGRVRQQARVRIQIEPKTMLQMNPNLLHVMT